MHGPPSQLDEWLSEITETLDAYNKANPDKPAAPFAVNQIVHRSNDRLEHDVEMCVKYKVPIVITSLGAPPRIKRRHPLLWWDHPSRYHKQPLRPTKAIEKGADGLIAIAAGAGGHAGTLSPIALIQEIREWFERAAFAWWCHRNRRQAILAAQAMGADMGYIGSAFIATKEARAVDTYKQMIADSTAEDIVYSNLFTGVHGNYLKGSVIAAGMDPANLPEGNVKTMDFGTDKVKAWKDIWGSGQGVGGCQRCRARCRSGFPPGQ